MDTITAIKSRRSVKQFDASHNMSDSEIKNMISIACESPTAFNIQHWRFVAVTDKDLRQKIREVSWDQAQVTDASVLFILCADLKAWEKEPIRYWRDAPQQVADMMVPAIGQFYNDRDQMQRDEAMRSCGIAAQTLMLTAKASGYDSCPMDGFDFDAVGKLINLPDDHIITMFVVVGKASKEVWEKPGQLPVDEVLINNSF